MKMLLTLALLLSTACIAGQRAQPVDAQDAKPVEEAKEEDKEAKSAWSLTERDNWIEKTEIMLKKSAPPQFSAILHVNMPTPGWELKVDEVGKPDAQGRIQVKVTATPPDGIVAQVITSQSFHASLGELSKGEYLLEVVYRKNGEETYTRRGTVMLTAG
ncbi:MAG: protease complex subunit PrcB family protein [Planctomycetes bacterium]|nr:protease complex subunit PrcB family protein [Planctomycetota bacterium]